VTDLDLDDDLAYDGSNRPQDRPLTARERDILTRILFDILHELHRSQSLSSLMFIDGQGGIRMDNTEIQSLIEMRNILDPRER
jgi:hypothetical protein